MQILSGSSGFPWEGVSEAYRQFPTVSESTPVITLQAGKTPLIRAMSPQKRLDIDLDISCSFAGIKSGWIIQKPGYDSGPVSGEAVKVKSNFADVVRMIEKIL